MIALLATLALADSPLTSTQWSVAYDDVPAVLHARQAGLDKPTLKFLLAPNPLPIKVAIVDALGWTYEGQNNSGVYLTALAKQHKKPIRDLADLNPDEKLIYGYMLAMDRYLDLSPPGLEGVLAHDPLEIVDQAAYEKSDFTHEWIASLVHAQSAMDTSWCEVYMLPRRTLDAHPNGFDGFRDEAVSAAMAYMSEYSSSCDETGQERGVDDTDPAQQDMIYSLAFAGDRLVAGTQGGLVIWTPDGPVVHEKFICDDLLVGSWGVLAGCETGFVRYDGAFVDLAPQQGASEVPQLYEIDGKAHAVWASSGFRLDGAEMVDEPPLVSGYDVLVRKNGDRWGVDFLNGLIVNNQEIPSKGPVYPGSDPRSLYEDPQGRLWVVDFEQGYFLFDERSKTFARVQTGPASGGSGVAVDARTGLIAMLEYTRGLWIVEGRGSPVFVDLSDVGYLRGVDIDAQGRIWVGGNTGIVAVEKGPTGAFTVTRRLVVAQ